MRVGGCRGSRQPAASRSLSFSLPPSAVAAMVKVSFNSALAQKEAAKKEEENSQVLILPPDAKVRAAGAADSPGAAQCPAPRVLLGARCRRGTAARRSRLTVCFSVVGFLFFFKVPLSHNALTGRQGELHGGAPLRAPPPLTLLKWLTAERALKLRSSALWDGSGGAFCFLLLSSPTALGPPPGWLLTPSRLPLCRPDLRGAALRAATRGGAAPALPAARRAGGAPPPSTASSPRAER